MLIKKLPNDIKIKMFEINPKTCSNNNSWGEISIIAFITTPTINLTVTKIRPITTKFTVVKNDNIKFINIVIIKENIESLSTLAVYISTNKVGKNNIISATLKLITLVISKLKKTSGAGLNLIVGKLVW